MYTILAAVGQDVESSFDPTRMGDSNYIFIVPLSGDMGFLLRGERLNIACPIFNNQGHQGFSLDPAGITCPPAGPRNLA